MGKRTQRWKTWHASLEMAYEKDMRIVGRMVWNIKISGTKGTEGGILP